MTPLTPIFRQPTINVNPMSSSILTPLSLVLLAASAYAQIGGGSLVGTVRDPAGAAVPGAQIVATNQDTNEQRSVRTNGEGYYEFPLLVAGPYRLEAEATGFNKVRSEVFTLSTGTRPRLDLALTLGAVNEKVEVTAAAPLINTTTTDLGVVMSRERAVARFGLRLTRSGGFLIARPL